MRQRTERLHILISIIVIAYLVVIQEFLAKNVLFNPLADQIFVFLTSIGFYRLLVIFVFWLANRSNLILRMTWGKEYLNGIWTYKYDIDGKEYMGIWRISQSLYDVSITGYGLDEDLKIRSTFRSITPLFRNQGLYEIVFLRSIVSEPDRQHIAKTSLFFDNFKRGRLMSAPNTIRAQTLILGGPESGTSHVDIRVIKHGRATSEQEVLASLRVPGTSDR